EDEGQSRCPEGDAAACAQTTDTSLVRLCGGLGTPEAGMVPPARTSGHGGIHRVFDDGRWVSFRTFLRGAPAKSRRRLYHPSIRRRRLPRKILRSARMPIRGKKKHFRV